jgi:hypothetical protein
VPRPSGNHAFCWGENRDLPRVLSARLRLAGVGASSRASWALWAFQRLIWPQPHGSALLALLLERNRAKDAARSEAIRRWPSKAGLFARKMDDGRAEAALIAVAGLARFNGVGMS